MQEERDQIAGGEAAEGQPGAGRRYRQTRRQAGHRKRRQGQQQQLTVFGNPHPPNNFKDTKP